MENALKLSKFHIDCFSKISKISIEMKNNSKESYVIEWIRTHQLKEITPSKLHKSNKSRIKTIEEAKVIIESLDSQNYGYIVHAKNGLKFIVLN